MAMINFSNFLENTKELKDANPEFKNKGKINPEEVRILDKVTKKVAYNNAAHMSYEFHAIQSLRPILVYNKTYLLYFPSNEKELIKVSQDLNMHYHTYGEVIENAEQLIFFLKDVKEEEPKYLGVVNSIGDILALYGADYKEKPQSGAILTEELKKHPRWKINVDKFLQYK